MAVEYYGENAKTFQDDDWTYILNGSLASSSIFRKIAMNQTWLAVHDAEAMNFFTSTAGQTPAIPVYSAVSIRMPPFAQYVEFWFLCERNADDAASPYAWIGLGAVESGDSKVANMVFGGSNPAGKGAAWEGSREARWVVFTGTTGGTGGTEDPLAVKTVATPVNTWSEVNVTIGVSDTTGLGGDIRIFTGYYRVLPATGPLPSWA
jgi:hypothetical protein